MFIENSFNTAGGAKSTTANFAASKASIKYDAVKTSPEKLSKLVRGAGRVRQFTSNLLDARACFWTCN